MKNDLFWCLSADWLRRSATHLVKLQLAHFEARGLCQHASPAPAYPPCPPFVWDSSFLSPRCPGRIGCSTTDRRFGTRRSKTCWMGACCGGSWASMRAPSTTWRGRSAPRWTAWWPTFWTSTLRLSSKSGQAMPGRPLVFSCWRDEPMIDRSIYRSPLFRTSSYLPCVGCMATRQTRWSVTASLADWMVCLGYNFEAACSPADFGHCLGWWDEKSYCVE